MSKLQASEYSVQVRMEAEALGQLFDLMDGCYLFAKDLNHRYCRCNQPLWRDFGHASEEEMLGQTDTDYFPPSVAQSYYEHDLQVIRTGKAILNDVWLVPSSNSLRWYRIHKVPVFNTSNTSGKNNVIGVAGTMVPYEGPGPVPPEYDRVKPALVIATRTDGIAVSVRELAAASGYSMNQFTRVFRSLFHMKPVEFLMRLRLARASRLLRSKGRPIVEIAIECGFYDQSSFTKAFRRQFGVTPLRYRQSPQNLYGGGGPPDVKN
ncbi:MAG: helix-turn-helix domain-containing protein [Verrucomicrobiales bacterium]|nr:helix-turn-helix domain-containing protein [Verrucomicrobiales bacterium]